MDDARTIALVSVIATAPLAICFIVAVLRGYSIHVSFTRGGKGRRGDD